MLDTSKVLTSGQCAGARGLAATAGTSSSAHARALLPGVEKEAEEEEGEQLRAQRCETGDRVAEDPVFGFGRNFRAEGKLPMNLAVCNSR